MKARYAIGVLGLHTGLLVLASTKFTVVTGWWHGDWTWNWFEYTYRNGWGYVYRSDYSPAVVLTYVAAYGAGLAGYALAGRLLPAGAVRGVAKTGVVLGAALSGIGLISFLIEASHWVSEHHLSWILSSPGAGLVIALATMIGLAVEGKKRRAEVAAVAG